MKNLRKNTVLKVTITFILLMIAIDVVIWMNIESFVLESVKTETHEKINLAKKLIPDSLLKNVEYEQLKKIADEIKRLTDSRFTLIDKEGIVIADSEIPVNQLSFVENHINRKEVQEALKGFSGIARRTSATIDQDLIYYCEKLTDNGRVTGFIRFAIYSTNFDEKIAFSRQLMIYLNIVLLLFVIIGTYLRTSHLNKQFQNLHLLLKPIEDGKKEFVTTNQVYEEFDAVYSKVKGLLEKSFENEKLLQIENEKLTKYLNSLNFGIAAFDEKGILIFRNKKFRKIMEIEKAQCKIEYTEWLRFPPLTKDISDFLTHGKRIKKTTKYYGHKYIHYEINPLNISNEEEFGFILNVEDVTHLQKLETIKKDFIANVSHEFKTPLTSIKGYSETLLSGSEISKEISTKFLTKIFNQTIHLENIVSDLLNLSKIEQGDVLKIKNLNPFKAIPNIVNDFANNSEDIAQHLKTKIEYPEYKVWIKADKNLLKTIVTNLLSNAFQYGGREEDVYFNLKRVGKSVRIEVIDHGIGIIDKDLDRIFERFYRTDSARETYTEGSGLGLALVKNAVQQSNGTYGVESEIGKGSLFWIELPITKLSDKSSPNENHEEK